MKLKDGFILRQVAGEHVVLSVSANVDLNGMITLNDTGCTLWKRLESEAELADLAAALQEEYEVDDATALAAAQRFVDKLKELDLLA
ncbi:MAG: PqqD family protein [Oscillospiraceae bacterium]|nr:PqqD family protein [Oscillospiraceae bacterium]